MKFGLKRHATQIWLSSTLALLLFSLQGGMQKFAPTLPRIIMMDQLWRGSFPNNGEKIRE